MATSTLIQYLESVDGSGVALSGEISHRRQVETYLSGGAVTAGDVVMFDTSAAGAARALTVVQCANTATGEPRAAGVALDSAAGAGEKVRVVVAGYAEDVNSAAGVLLGEPLSAGKAAAGQVENSAATDLAGPFGVALENEAGGTVDLMVFKRF